MEASLLPSARCSLTRRARPPRKLGRPRICSCTSRGTLYRAPRIFLSARSRARVAFCATKSAKPEVSLGSVPAASVHRARRSDAVAGSPATIRHRLGSRLSTQACLNQFGSRGSPNVSRLSALEDRLPSCKGPCQMTRSGAIKGSPPPARVASSSGPSRLRPRLREGGEHDELSPVCAHVFRSPAFSPSFDEPSFQAACALREEYDAAIIRENRPLGGVSNPACIRRTRCNRREGIGGHVPSLPGDLRSRAEEICEVLKARRGEGRRRKARGRSWEPKFKCEKLVGAASRTRFLRPRLRLMGVGYCENDVGPNAMHWASGVA